MRIVLVLMMISIGFTSCKKDDPEMCISAEEPEQWEKFIGDYLVYDTTGVFLYEMNISHLFSGDNEVGTDVDSILISNLADRFDVRLKYRSSNPSNFLDIGFINPQLDHDGNRWFLSDQANDPETEVQENTLINDTLVLNYRMVNTPYWVQDEVPYFLCYCKEIAVKQN